MWKCLEVGSPLNIKLLAIVLYTKQKYAGKVSYEAPKCLFFLRFLWLYDSKTGRSLVVFHCWSSGSLTLPCTQLHQFDNGGWDTTDVQAISFSCRKMDWGYWRERGRNDNYAVFQTFFFWPPPTWGNYPIWRAYFSNGLKPPTRQNNFKRFLAFFWHEVSCPENFGTIHHMIRVILHRTFLIICK